MCEVFGFDSLNNHQEEALRFVFEPKSDVFVNLQLLVVLPLINLMKDQVSRLNSCRIGAISYSVMSAPC